MNGACSERRRRKDEARNAKKESGEAGEAGEARSEEEEAGEEEEEKVPQILYVGVIDILQSFDARKLAESRLKRLKAKVRASVSGTDPVQVSAVDATKYASRFVSFVAAHFGC